MTALELCGRLGIKDPYSAVYRLRAPTPKGWHTKGEPGDLFVLCKGAEITFIRADRIGKSLLFPVVEDWFNVLSPISDNDLSE